LVPSSSTLNEDALSSPEPLKSSATWLAFSLTTVPRSVTRFLWYSTESWPRIATPASYSYVTRKQGSTCSDLKKTTNVPLGCLTCAENVSSTSPA
jgi:hypothetical protein